MDAATDTVLDAGESARRAQDRDYHDAIAAEYDRVIVVPRAPANDLLFEPLLRGLGGARMVDLGCGTGHMTLRAARRFGDVEAVDHSAGMLRMARAHCADAGLTHVRFVESDIDDWLQRARAGIDLVTCVGFLHHLAPAHVDALLAHVATLLAAGGSIVIAEPIAVADAPPAAIDAWNAASPLAAGRYSSDAEEPDEAPLDEAVLRAGIAAAGLRVAGESRCWEILAHSTRPGFFERRRIRRLFRAHQGHGNVLALRLQSA